MIRPIETLGMVVLLGLVLAACQSENTEQPVSGNRDAGSAELVAAGQPESGDQPALNNEVVISDIAAWYHPVKSLLAASPFELYKVVLTNDSTYPKFYVHYPDADAVNGPQDLSVQLLRIAKEIGYWDYELVNEQDAMTIQVKVDKSKKRLADVQVNGQPYIAPIASSTLVHPVEEANVSPIDESEADEIDSGRAGSVSLPEPYAKFVEDTGLGDSYGPVYIEQADLNGDGTEEAIVAFGDDDYIIEAYVLGIQQSKVTQWGGNFAEGYGYGVSGIQLVHMEDRQEPVMLLDVTNGYSMSGFHLYTFDGQEPVAWEYSASPTGSGNDQLTDSDNDGKYDGYVQERGDYDVLNYSVSRWFELRWGQFDHTRTTVGIGEYPSSAKEAAIQYAELYSLDDGLSPEVKQRLSELGPALTEADRNTFEKLWEPFGTDGSYSELELLQDETNFSMQTNKKTNETTVIVTESMDNGKDGKLTFRLAQQDGRWVIVGFL